MKVEIHKDYPGNLVSEIENFLRLDPDQSIPQRFAETVAAHPESVAIKVDELEITFEELNRRSNRIARKLISAYKGKAGTVGLLFGHSPLSIISIYAVLKAGKIFVPLDKDHPLPQLQFIISDSELEVIITNHHNHLLAESLLPKGGRIIDVEDIDSSISDDDLEFPIPSDSIAAIYYTSGSTGKPKGIIKKHKALNCRPYGFGVGDRQALLSSFAFSASLSTIFSALLSGVTICFYDIKEKGIGHLADWLIENQITVFFPAVSLFHQFAKILTDEDYFPQLKLVQLGGQRVEIVYLREFRRHISKDCIIKYTLASSEAGASAVMFITADTDISGEIIPVGYPPLDKKIMIIGEDGEELGANEVGEIVVKGRFVAGGYWGEAQKDQEKFLIDPKGQEETIVYTGDMGFLHPDGKLEFRGRKDEMVKVSGYRVELPVVEAALTNLDDILEAAVQAIETNSGNKRLVAYLSTSDGNVSRIREIRKELTRKLPRYMLPTQYIFLENLPKLPNGKIDRSALPEPSPVNIARDNDLVPPKSGLEMQLVKIWENIIGIDEIGIEDDFFAMGGDSLQAMRIFVEIERMLGKKLPLSLLFQASTVSQQASLLQDKDWAADWSSLVEVQPDGNAPPLLCLPGVGGNVLNFHDLSKYLGNDQPVYALQSKGIGGLEEPLTHIIDIARYHIQAIKEVQPIGPYYLCGSSFGGKVAYEIAQQLYDLGDEVSLVVMFDTYGPNYPKRLPGMTRRKVKINRQVQKFQKHLKNLRNLDLQGKIHYLKFRLPSSYQRLHLWISNRYQELRYPLPQDLKKVRKANKLAGRYTIAPPKFGGRLVLFRASHQPYGLVPDPLLGWGAVAKDRMVVIEVEGHHDTLLWEPQVGKAAEILKRLLKATHAVEEAI
jgi:acyl-coenzyme A synthetase/AMP-(fatty) acid ligase/thioesterase domain-containing protein/acyl carrier protein